MSLIFPYNFSDDNIVIFRSSDYEPITYEVSGTTYYCPRITFNGQKNGKILGIKAIDADGKFRTFEPSMLLHFGSNIFEPFTWFRSSGSREHVCGDDSYGGIYVKYLGNGGYWIHGTATSTGTITIGSVWTNFINSDYGINSGAFDFSTMVRGNAIYDENVRIGNSTTHANNYEFGDTVTISNWSASSILSNRCDVYISFLKNAVVDCIIYPEIKCMIQSLYTPNYEKPFVGRSISGIVTEKYGIPTNGTTNSKSGSSSHYHDVNLNANTGNASNYGIIDYPIVHTGVNNFVYTYGITDPNNLLKFEIYYDPTYHYEHIKKIKDELNEIEYSISNGRINKPIITFLGSNYADYSPHITLDNHYAWYASKYNPTIAPRSPYLPNGIYMWHHFSNQMGYSSMTKTLSGNTYRDIVNGLFSESYYAKIYGLAANRGYIPKTNFAYANNVPWGARGASSADNADATGLLYPNGQWSTSTSSLYSRLILDYDGWDDSVSYDEEENAV